jgi:4-amino-4-deoxy-L-arabinose transferase-like glycosyltransferase
MEQSSPKSPEPGRLRRRDYLILVIFAAGLLLFRLGSKQTFSFHESLVAESAREMETTGDWLIPRIAGEPFLEKPPLAYWTVALLGEIWGLDEFVARLPSVVCGLAGVLLLANLAARYYGATIGLLAGLIQSTTVYFVVYARLAEVDIYLWLFVMAGIVIFAARWIEPVAAPGWYNGRVAFFVILGATQMTKGPLFGAVLLLLPCVAFMLLSRRAAWRWLISIPGLLVCILLSVAWPLAVIYVQPDAARVWYEHTIGRMMGGHVNPAPPWYYFTMLPQQLLPWVLVVLPALPASLRRAKAERGSIDCFLWLWFVLPLAALSLAKGKHHHYLIHALPPFSIWSAQGLLRCRAYLAVLWCRPLARAGLWALTCGALAAALLILPAYVGRAIVMEVGIVVLVAAIVFGALSWSVGRRRFQLAGVLLFGLVWLLYAYIHGTWQDRTDAYAEETILLRRFNVELRGQEIVTYRMDPARALLYTQARAVKCWEPGELAKLIRPNGPSYVLCFTQWERDLDRFGPVVTLGRTPAQVPFRPRGRVGLYRIDGQGRRVVEAAGAKPAAN